MIGHEGRGHGVWLRYGGSFIFAAPEQLRFASEDEVLVSDTMAKHIRHGARDRAYHDVRREVPLAERPPQDEEVDHGGPPDQDGPADPAQPMAEDGPRSSADAAPQFEAAPSAPPAPRQSSGPEPGNDEVAEEPATGRGVEQEVPEEHGHDEVDGPAQPVERHAPQTPERQRQGPAEEDPEAEPPAAGSPPPAESPARSTSATTPLTQAMRHDAGLLDFGRGSNGPYRREWDHEAAPYTGEFYSLVWCSFG